MQVKSLGQENPLEEGIKTHSSILAWRIPCSGEPGRLQSMALQRIRYVWSDLACTHIPADWRQVFRGGTQFPSEFSTLLSLTFSSESPCKNICLKPPSDNPSLRKQCLKTWLLPQMLSILKMFLHHTGRTAIQWLSDSSSFPVKNRSWPSFFTLTLRLWFKNFMASHISAKGFCFSMSIPYQ